MSVSCHRQRGFTLLELLVVMGLVSIVSAVVFPGLIRLYDSVAGSLEREEIVLKINGLGRKSFQSGIPFTLNPHSLEMPEGWQIKVDRPISYSASGVCEGGVLTLIKSNELQLKERLRPPFCQLADES